MDGASTSNSTANKQKRNNKSSASADIDYIVTNANVMKQLISVNISAVESKTKSAWKLQEMALQMKYDIDRQEQYSRWESIRISDKEKDIIKDQS